MAAILRTLLILIEVISTVSAADTTSICGSTNKPTRLVPLYQFVAGILTTVHVAPESDDDRVIEILGNSSWSDAPDHHRLNAAAVNSTMECPLSCLFQLPSNITQPTSTSIYCAAGRRYCMATVPLYWFTAINGNDEHHYASTSNRTNSSHHTIANHGQPLCYLWSFGSMHHSTFTPSIGIDRHHIREFNGTDHNSTSTLDDGGGSSYWRRYVIAISVAAASLVVIGIVALFAILFIKTGRSSKMRVEPYYSVDRNALTPPRIAETQSMPVPVYVSDPRGNVIYRNGDYMIYQ